MPMPASLLQRMLPCGPGYAALAEHLLPCTSYDSALMTHAAYEVIQEGMLGSKSVAAACTVLTLYGGHQARGRS